MKTYHSIPKFNEDYFGKYIFAFDKIDGSNFRAEWDRKLSKKSRFTNGFGKFGTRGETIKNTRNPFYEGVEIFKDKYSEELDNIFRTHKRFLNIDKITVYGEFFGSKSFAGTHDWKEPHDVKLFDIFLYKKDYLAPSEFIKIFENLDICKPIFQGEFSKHFVNMIEDNYFDLKEGVVCKGSEDKKVFMFKIKTNKWINRVKTIYGDSKALEY